MVRSFLLDRLMSGELEPGCSLNERQLSEEFGISRTPLREALLRLELEGLLLSRPGKGFSVPDLDPRTGTELMTLAARMEKLAVRLTGRYTPDRLETLRRVDRRRLEGVGDRVEALKGALAWHEELVADCGNGQLLRLLQRVRTVLRLFAPKLPAEPDRVREAVRQHGTVLDALEAGKSEAASRALQRHWDWCRRTLEPA